MEVSSSAGNFLHEVVIPSGARDLHFAADSRSLATLGMTIYQGYLVAKY